MKANHILTVGEEALLKDIARVLRETPTKSRGVDDFREIPEHLAVEWARRLEEMTGG